MPATKQALVGALACGLLLLAVAPGASAWTTARGRRGVGPPWGGNMDLFFDNFFEAGASTGGRAAPAPAPASTPREIEETDTAWHIALDTAGFLKDELVITLESRLLRIQGTKKCAKGTLCFPRALDRTFDLTRAHVDVDGMSASRADDGALQITLPKTEDAAPRNILIKAKNALPLPAPKAAAPPINNAAVAITDTAKDADSDATAAKSEPGANPPVAPPVGSAAGEGGAAHPNAGGAATAVATTGTGDATMAQKHGDDANVEVIDEETA